MHGDLPILKYFHKRGASVHAAKDTDGRTPLHLAASFNTVEVVKQLITWGASVNARAEVSAKLGHA
jgi:ankyrin repeat protein